MIGLVNGNAVRIPLRVDCLDWYGLHGEGWGDLLVPDAYAHPAKVKRALARRIYAHLLERGYIERGQTVVDPFAGIAGFALHAMQSGLHWIGVELEEKFVGLGNQNITMWNERFSRLPHWGTAVLLQGDSRRLCEVVGEAGALISSPPWEESLSGKGKCPEMRPDGTPFGQGKSIDLADYGTSPGQLAAMPPGNHDAVIGSPPHLDTVASDDPDKRGGLFRDPKRREDKTLTAEYGNSDAQLAAMREGELDGIVSSPPYSTKTVHGQGGIDATKFAEPGRAGHNTQATSLTDYGSSDGQLANLPAGDAVVSSPPWEEVQGFHDKNFSDEWGPKQSRTTECSSYGNAQGQLGTETGETFWSAAHTIMRQCHAILKPGGVAVWVCKRFVRNKQIVEFSQQWAQLGEACGFEMVEWIRAWLTEDRGNARALFDFEVETKKGRRTIETGSVVHDAKNGIKDATLKRSSFFRILYESKYPENSIDWEDVIIQRKV